MSIEMQTKIAAETMDKPSSGSLIKRISAIQSYKQSNSSFVVWLYGIQV